MLNWRFVSRLLACRGHFGWRKYNRKNRFDIYCEDRGIWELCDALGADVCGDISPAMAIEAVAHCDGIRRLRVALHHHADGVLFGRHFSLSMCLCLWSIWCRNAHGFDSRFGPLPRIRACFGRDYGCRASLVGDGHGHRYDARHRANRCDEDDGGRSDSIPHRAARMGHIFDDARFVCRLRFRRYRRRIRRRHRLF